MVSTLETTNSSNDTAMDTVVPKTEPTQDGSLSSSVSTPEPEVETLTQDVAQTQKRKGGRKPVRKINCPRPCRSICSAGAPDCHVSATVLTAVGPPPQKDLCHV